MRSASGKDSIVETALRLFGERGIGATSLREVAQTAGASPALVVHHFNGKEGLIAAVDEAALSEFGSAYSAGGEPAEGSDLLRLRAEQTARAMQEHPEVCAYLGRALGEGTAGSRRPSRADTPPRPMKDPPGVFPTPAAARAEEPQGGARLFRLMINEGRAEID